ncbi:tetratricopeptide repeat protein [Piscinibacter sakaiensis]|uniref:Thioredoxin domain protein EC-YbbN n=1 Tax=Piscinibacter sakaiensis TaxID=1547922 RepID=A0A0K8P5H0_PISS1|nr:tetratricopeptide repeat protein [Piscinibacter sakaiensis]GAP37759.1 thioredoxin domain protein EC-YbbN [Piscinibacter sakaiensis]
MIDITFQNFEAELIHGSVQQPVLLDIWAPWCGPCKSLGPVLEKLEVAYAGRFKLAKLNSDEQPEIAGQLSQMFGVRSIPFCVMFREGQPVDGFVGALPESEIRAFLDKHVPSPDELAADEELLEAEELLADGETEGAIEKLKDAVALSPDNDTTRYEALRALLMAGRADEARELLAPVRGRVIPDARFTACALWLDALDAEADAPPLETLQAAIAANKRDFAARHALAQRHFAAQRFTEAMDELLEIILRDKAWNDELARRSFVAILEVMSKPAAPARPDAAAPKGTLEVAGRITATPADPVVDGYRRKLSMALF